VALPRSAQDVSAALGTLSIGAHAWEGKCQFAIRGGGHTPFAGAANIKDGIVMDLLHLPSKGLALDHKTVTVSPSMTWDQVYELLDEHKLSTLGTKVAGVGRHRGARQTSEKCADPNVKFVGVGGAALSCGVSYFSPRYGFICDMIENFEVVLATGDIVNANAKEHPRLWKALRGGGNNYGVVTAITLKTFDQGPFW
jgi:FAD/FMN-containing dehydrogenase